MTDTAPRPLDGLHILDATAGPMAASARLLGELGAEVIRIEPRDGGADRDEPLAFAANNLGKRSAALDLSIAEDRARFDTLCADADILIADASLPIDTVALRARFPALVILSIRDFGADGPLAGWQATGPVLHALSGELSRSGIPGRAPLLPPGDLAFACAAAQAAYVALIAYLDRVRSGTGDLIDFSILDGAAMALDPAFGISGSATAGVAEGQMPRGREEARYRYPIIPCKDGFVRVCVLAPRQWQGMFGWLGRPEAFADPSYAQITTRFASRTLIPAIATLFADLTRAEIEAAGQRHGVPTAALLDLDEALATDQMRARRAFVSMEIAAGISAPFPDGAIEIDGVRMGITGPPPAIGGATGWATGRAASAATIEGERPLSGLRVLDLGVIVVGAEQGRLLADQGADVVKVEAAAFPDGSRQARPGVAISISFAAGHRNQRSAGIDLRHPDGKALLLDLIRDTDVLLSNFKGGTLESLGLDHATLARINPRIIVVDSSAFGPTGPWSKRMGYGPLVRASAGLTAQWRYADDPASYSDAITVYPDHVAARIGVIGVLALLIRRLRTGEGGAVGISQAEVMLGQLAPQIAAAALTGAGHPVAASTRGPWGVFACAGDDEWCVVTARDDADRRALDSVLAGAPLEAWLAARDPLAAAEVLQAAGVPAAPMLRVADLPEFAYYAERGFFRRATHPHIAEPFWLEDAPARAEKLTPPPDRPAPLMAEHTAAILRERLALSEDAITALAEAGAIELSLHKEPA